jgi:hypothetical protein
MTAGAPTKYKPQYCEEIVAYFDYKPSIEQIVARKMANGLIEFPTFEKFASIIGVHVDTMIEWCDVHEEFSEAYKICKQMQKAFLIQMGLNGLYPAAAFCFVAKNCTDMRDKTEVENTHLYPQEIRIKSTKEMAEEKNNQASNVA